MSKYRITIENIPGMGGTLADAPMTIECDGLCVIGVGNLTGSEFRADTSIHAISPHTIASVIAGCLPLQQAVIAYETFNLLGETEDSK